MGFLSSLFSSSKKEETPGHISKDDQKNFDLLKYDGIRAMQVRQVGYAIKCFRKALEIQPDFETMRHLVNACILTGDSESALEMTDEMLIIEPEHTETLLARVNILFHLDRDGEAIADCDKVIELEPENYQAWFLRAKAKRATNDLPGAMTDVTGAITLKEDFTNAYLFRAEVLFAMKDGEKALDDVNKVIDLSEEGDETAYLLRGRIYELLGDGVAAADEYTKVIECNPFKEEAYLLAARLSVTQQRYDEAMAIYDEAIEHIDSFGKAYAMRGQLKELMGDKQGAEKDLRIAAELEPEDNEDGVSVQVNFDDMYKGGIF